MDIKYIANVRLPTEKAHGLQIMKASEAFKEAGVNIELIVPTRNNSLEGEPFAYYGIKSTFPLTYLQVPDIIWFGKIGFILQSVLFGFRAAKYISKNPKSVVYGRDEIVLLVIAFLGNKNIYWESHDGAWNIFAKHLVKRAKGIITVTRASRDRYAQKGVPAAKLFSTPNGIRIEDFSNTESSQTAKERLGLPTQQKIALYIGKIGGWKGVDTLLEASKLLPNDICVALIGGEALQIESLKNAYPKVRFLGSRPYTQIGNNEAAADVLILPNTALDATSVSFTSPLKLFSYMASRRPIIASDLPSIREIVDEKSAVFFTPDDPHSLAQVIAQVVRNPEAYKEVRDEAYTLALGYTWDARAKRLISFLQSLS
jgi:glycosyltransferase involved in cell wall biosynthesis